MSIETILPMDGLLNPGQHRLTSVQLVNWGTFDGAHTIRVDRAGTLLTGGSGVGKSTIFDGMLQVLDARPKMNKAAQTNSGQASEERRTAFSYMRGRLGAAPAAGDESRTATFYQRPGAIWSAVCLTFDNALGQTTSLAVMLDLPANGTEHNVAALPPAQQAAGHPPAGVGHGGPLQQDIVGDAAAGQAGLPTRTRRSRNVSRQALGIDQEKAFGLLRTLQTGKGLGGTVNDFFRNHVLDTPRTLAAAEEAVQDFSHLRSIRRQLERVRQQRDLLAPVPRLHQQLQETQSQLDRTVILADVALPLYRRRLALGWSTADRTAGHGGGQRGAGVGSDRGRTRRAQAADGTADGTVRQRGRRRRRHLGTGTGRSPVRAAGPPIGRGFLPGRSGGRGP